MDIVYQGFLLRQGPTSIYLRALELVLIELVLSEYLNLNVFLFSLNILFPSILRRMFDRVDSFAYPLTLFSWQRLQVT
jgi:hypothetical protein